MEDIWSIVLGLSHGASTIGADVALPAVTPQGNPSASPGGSAASTPSEEHPAGPPSTTKGTSRKGGGTLAPTKKENKRTWVNPDE